MNTTTPHTEYTPPITTPGHLLANIPGLLGFFPTESVLFLAIDTTPRGPAMGPLARVDIDQAQDALPDIAATLTEHAREGVFAFVVSHRPLTELREVATWLYGLTYARDGVDVDAAWHVNEISQGESYILLHGAVSTDGSGPMKKWVEGVIPPLTSAPTMRSCVDHNVVPELSREDFFAVFTRRNPHVDQLEAEVMARQARHHATTLRACVAAADPQERTVLVDDFLAEARWQLTRAANPEESEADADLLAACAVWLSTTWTRDLVVAECAAAGDKAAHLLLAAARTFDGEIRANALTLFAVAQLELDWEILAGPALMLVTEEFPSHRLGSLLCQAYRHGLHERIRDTVATGARAAYETAVGASDAPSEPSRRAAG
ncbi:DUF4192 domain-containing protein [Corynebacterium sp. YSMAA1_1_D6]|uniref:DUF4192 domain-containing protein n=1 Tax=Corynebacterium sp. YSMAA1_1_D6 TaxID=3383589 RepID=UPI0038D17271